MEINNLRLNVSFYEDTADLDDAEFGRLVRYGFGYLSGNADIACLTGAEKVFARQIRRYVDEDNEKYIETCNRNRENVRRRWNRADDTTVYDRIPNDTTVYGTIPLDTKNTNTKTKTKTNNNIPPNPPKGLDEGFERFWKAYPKKLNKKDALKAWSQVMKGNPVPVEELVTAINEQKCSRDWTKDDGQYIPYPSTWLRGEMWNNKYGSVAKISSPDSYRELTEEDMLF